MTRMLTMLSTVYNGNDLHLQTVSHTRREREKGFGRLAIVT